MKQKIKNLYDLVTLGLSLGTTIFEKVRLTLFLINSRIFPSGRAASYFNVSMHGVPLRIHLRRNFADAFILEEIFRGNDYALSLAVDPAVIVDLGANLGFAALSFAVRYPRAHIFCFEPDPKNFAELTANTASFPTIKCFPYAIGSKKEKRFFYTSPIFHMRNSLIARSGNEDRIEVSVIPLDEAFRIAGIQKVDLLKFDVEGAEAEIVSSFARWEIIRALVGELHPYLWKGDEQQQLIDTLQKHYTITIRKEGTKTFLAGVAL